MAFNEETHILDRLGILSSKLECPNKQFPVSNGKDKSASRDMNPVPLYSVTATKDGDEWGAFSLDELSSSREDSEFLFDRREYVASLQIFPRIGTTVLLKLFALFLVSVASFAVTFFVWWNGNGVSSGGQVPRPSFAVPGLFYFTIGILLLLLSYALFLFMLAKLRKNQRQQQIAQLSVALNGDAQKCRKKVKPPRGRRTKGPYKELFSPIAGDESNDANFVHTILGDSEEETESEGFIGLEMESIDGGQQKSDGGQRTDKRPERNILV